MCWLAQVTVPADLMLNGKSKNYNLAKNSEDFKMELIIVLFLSAWLAIAAFLSYRNVKKEYTEEDKNK